MGILGVSAIVASVAYILLCPVEWLPESLARLRRGLGGALPSDTRRLDPAADPKQNSTVVPPIPEVKTEQDDAMTTAVSRRESDAQAISNRKARDVASMPPPPVPTIQHEEAEEETTPKAMATEPSMPVPTFSLTEETPSSPTPDPPAVMAPPPRPATSMRPPAPTSMAPPPRPTGPSMAPPPRPSQFLGPNSIQRARGPVPNRNPLAPPTSSSSLAPPPTSTSKPKSSRKITLAPGRSPLDWARISGPAADLRGVPPSTPYLRVTPSMLKRQNGRRGTDAWMGLNGKVYNISPYAEFHPGGVGELMRGAGKDGTKLFGEIHPWVNYDTMLSSCLVGLLVDEPEGQESEMDRMD